jgi:hypothetical protein
MGSDLKPTREFVKSECKRVFSAISLLSSLDNAGKAQIIETLMTHCRSAEHVTATLKHFAENSFDLKNPIAGLVASARQTAMPEQPPAGCPECRTEPDPQTAQERWATHVNREIKSHGAQCAQQRTCDCPTISVAVRCSCPRGRWLRQRDAEREASTTSAKPERLSRFDSRADESVA